MDPQIAALVTQLSQLAITNSATAVMGRVKAARAGREQQEQINALVEIINELVDDRNQLIGVAQGFEQQLSGRSISREDIKFITETLLPAIESLLPMAGGSMVEATKTLAAIRNLLSPEVLTVMQLIGFNYRAAIGEPLTDLLRNWILAKAETPRATTTVTRRK